MKEEISGMITDVQGCIEATKILEVYTSQKQLVYNNHLQIFISMMHLKMNDQQKGSLLITNLVFKESFELLNATIKSYYT